MVEEGFDQLRRPVWLMLYFAACIKLVTTVAGHESHLIMSPIMLEAGNIQLCTLGSILCIIINRQH
jgi:hypothetical protein